MSLIRVGSDVKVKGITYRVIHIHNASSAGSKFFGRLRFFLAREDGRVFSAFGKTVNGNSSLHTVDEDEAKLYGVTLPETEGATSGNETGQDELQDFAILAHPPMSAFNSEYDETEGQS